jgi:predicted component of type VI protein secretion system
MDQTKQESCKARPMVESDSKSVQEMREILQATLKSVSSKNASSVSKGTAAAENKVITSEEVNPSPDVAPETDTAMHLLGGKEPNA